MREDKNFFEWESHQFFFFLNEGAATGSLHERALEFFLETHQIFKWENTINIFFNKRTIISLNDRMTGTLNERDTWFLNERAPEDFQSENVARFLNERAPEDFLSENVARFFKWKGTRFFWMRATRFLKERCNRSFSSLSSF